MIYLSAGHHINDPGASGNGYTEANLTMELRGLVVAEIKRLGGKVILDNDNETLGQYIARIKPGSGSVLCELHFNSSSSAEASGVECLHQNNAAGASVRLSTEIASAISQSLGINNRGAKSERESARGRLGILNTKAGIACLPEICFITNKNDMQAYQAKKTQIAVCIAHILLQYDKLYN